MNPLAAHCINDLTHRFPIEIIWRLDARLVPGCELPKDQNLILVTSGDTDPHVVQHHVEQNLRALAVASEMGVVVFPPSVLQIQPRPLLVKMALMYGEAVYQRHPQEQAV